MTNRISGTEALKRVADGAILIDVRSAKGRAANGEVRDAVIIGKAAVLTFLRDRSGLSESDQPIVIFCGSVAGSGPVIEQLVAAGITRAVDVDGGFAALTGPGGLALAEQP
ncbi:rhodanese-like domain-containing protein [Bosea sp. 2KB_26]|uniref:rhodanese-like domain-containing protein n=1 Tax=Bosea sp. 2KB_26 TaxID=3237475 RepID=UPI000DE4F8F8